MKFITRNRPSAAMIVAVLAVSLGLGGSAVAASGVLTKKQVKQVKTISNKQITKRAPGLAVASAKRADTATSADTAGSAGTAARADTAKSADTAGSAGTAARADTAKSADTAGRATNVDAANVDAGGSLLGSVPAGVTAERASAGVYRVTFTRSVAGCLISSSLGSNDPHALPGSTNVVPEPGTNPNRVAVVTFNSAGAKEDRDFYVQMVCP